MFLGWVVFNIFRDRGTFPLEKAPNRATRDVQSNDLGGLKSHQNHDLPQKTHKMLISALRSATTTGGQSPGSRASSRAKSFTGAIRGSKLLQDALTTDLAKHEGALGGGHESLNHHQQVDGAIGPEQSLSAVVTRCGVTADVGTQYTNVTWPTHSPNDADLELCNRPHRSGRANLEPYGEGRWSRPTTSLLSAMVALQSNQL